MTMKMLKIFLPLAVSALSVLASPFPGSQINPAGVFDTVFARGGMACYSDWKVIYCNKPYNSQTATCGGHCTTWDTAQGPAVSAPDTQCIIAAPGSVITFSACNVYDGGLKYDCVESTEIKQKWIKDGDNVIYNTPPTNEILVVPCPSNRGEVSTQELEIRQPIPVEETATDCNYDLWRVLYCSKPYNHQTGTCGGGCTRWRPGISPQNTPDTDCISIYPGSEVGFNACSVRKCTLSSEWNPALKFVQKDGTIIFNAPSTEQIGLIGCAPSRARKEPGKPVEPSRIIYPMRATPLSRVKGGHDTISNSVLVKDDASTCDVARWKVTFCAGGYDSSKVGCSGPCTTWDHSETYFYATNTRCVEVSPGADVVFEACKVFKSPAGFDEINCTASADLAHKHVIGNGEIIYETPGTGYMIIRPCGWVPTSGSVDREDLKVSSAAVLTKRNVANVTTGACHSPGEERDEEYATGAEVGTVARRNTIASSDTCDITQWKITYCDEEFNLERNSCGGKCQYWDYSDGGFPVTGVDMLIWAQKTQCIATWPNDQVIFEACNLNSVDGSTQDMCTLNLVWDEEGGSQKFDIGDGWTAYNAPNTAYLKVHKSCSIQRRNMLDVEASAILGVREATHPHQCDFTNWKITFCDGHFDAKAQTCGGHCDSWAYPQEGFYSTGVDDWIESPKTRCMMTWPGTFVNFSPCKVEHGPNDDTAMCISIGDLQQWKLSGGWTAYNTPDTDIFAVHERCPSEDGSELSMVGVHV